MNRDKRNILILIVLAIVFRLFLLRYRFVISFDEPHYLQMAVSFAQGNLGGLLHSYWAPGYPFIAGLFSLFIKNYEFAGRLANIVIGSLTIVPVYALTQRIWNKKIAYLSAIFIAFLPNLAFFQTAVLAEPTYMFFGFLGVWFGWQALEKKGHNAILAGFFWGMAYLAKPEGIGFLLVFLAILSLYITIAFWKRLPEKKLWVVALVIIGFIIPASSYLIYLRHEAGYWTISAKGKANQLLEATYYTAEDDYIFDHLNEDNTRLPIDEIYHTGTFLKHSHLMTPKIGISVKLVIRKYFTQLFQTLKYGVPSMLTLPLIILFALGLFARPWSNDSILPSLYVLAFLLFFWFILVPFFHLNERYFLMMMPAAAIWIGAGIFVLWEWLTQQLQQLEINKPNLARLAGSSIGLLILALSFVPEMGRIVKNSHSSPEFWGEPRELKMAGQWLKKNSTEESPIVMSYNKAVDFYAGNYQVRSGVTYSKDSTDRILEYARHRGVDYFVLEERYLKEFPNIEKWFHDELPVELKLVYDEAGPSGLRARLLTWRDKTPPQNATTKISEMEKESS